MLVLPTAGKKTQRGSCRSVRSSGKGHLHSTLQLSMACPAVLTGRIAVLAGSAMAAQAKLLDNKAFQHAVSELQMPVALDAQHKPRLS